jgi:hypothetical protein
VSFQAITACEQRLATKYDHLIGRAGRSVAGPIDKTVVPADYFKTSLANLVFCY